MAPNEDGEGQAPTTTQLMEDGEPPVSEEEEYAEAVTRHAKYLGIDPEIDAEYMWIAEEALDADVPEGWVTGEGEGEYAGLVYYYNEATGESTWDHPLDEYYRDKFKRKKDRKAEKKRQHSGKKNASESRTYSSSSRSRRRSSSRRPRLESDTEKDDRRESRRRKSSDKHGSSSRGDLGGHDSQSSRHRDSRSSRHRRSDQQDGDRTRGDEDEKSKHRTSSNRNKLGGDSRVGGDGHSSSTRHRNTSNRRKSDGDDDRTHGDESEYGQRRRKGSLRGEEDGQGKGESKRRHRSQSREDARGSNDHRGSGNVSKSDEEERSLRRRPTDNSGEGDDDGVAVSPDRQVSLPSNGQRGGTNAKVKDGDKGEKSKGGVKPSEGTKSTGRQSQSRRPRGETNTLEVSPTTSRKNGYGTEKAEAANGAMAGTFSDKEDRDHEVQTEPTAVETAGEVVDLVSLRKKSLPDPSEKSASAAPARNTTQETRTLTGAAGSSDKCGAVEVPTVAWNDNDMEELDFEDEMRGIEGDDSGDKNPYDAGKTSILAAVPVRNAEIVSPSAKSRDDGSRNKRHATPSSPSSRTSKAAGADKGRRQSDRQEPLVNTSQNQDETENKTGRDSKNFTEDDTLSRRRSHYRSNDENHNAEPRNRGLPTSVMERANEDPNDWPEVSGNPTSRDVRKDSTGNDGDGSWRNQDEQSSGRDVNSDRNSEREIRRRSRDELRDGADAGEKYLDRDHDGWSAHGDRKDWVSGMGRNKTKYRDSARERGVEKGTEVFRTPDGRESSGGAYLGGGGGRGYGHGCNQGENHGDSEDRWHQRRIHLEGERVSRDSDRQAARGGRDHWESMKMEGQHQQHQLQLQHQLLLQQEAVARTKDLETKVMRLEASLAGVSSREDRLRGELADTARREGSTKERHIRELAEVTRKTEDLNLKLSRAISKTSEMAVAEVAGKEEGKRLRLELEGVRKKLEATEGTLSRKEEEVEAALAREIDAPRLRTMLASKEAETESQVKMLAGACAAKRPAAESSREVHRTRDLAERLRLEAAESNSRASTSEAALSQAASEMSALNNALHRTREEVSSKDSEAAKNAEEMNRLRMQLELEKQKCTDAEDRLLRAKASFESEVETLRARTAEFQSANASMEREMRNGEQDALSRLRESERERDAARYEAKRSAELAGSAETWRLKETLRAGAAEAKALTLGTEVAELRSQAARLRTSTDEMVEPHVRRNAELEAQLVETRREVAALTAEGKRTQGAHATEMASLKDEVSRKLPCIAEKAVSEAGRHWRKRVEEEMAAVRTERDRRLREFQTAMTEGEAKRHDDVAGARAEAERFRIVAERLAAENRSIRGELKQCLAREATGPPHDYGSRGSLYTGDSNREIAEQSPLKTVSAGVDNGDNSARREPPVGKAWEGVLQTQVLGQVEAHINALRVQLKNETPGVSALNDDGGPYPRGEEESARFPSPGGRQRPGHPADTTAGTTAVPPLSMETRGNYDLSPIPTERSGNEGGLTEIEDMRLNRLLRTSKSSASSTPPPPSGECMTWQRGAIIDGGSGGMPGSGDRLATVMADHQVGGVLAGDIGDVSRELFGTSPTPGNGDRGGTGWVREKNAFVASRRNRSIIDDEEDDLDDISDGGFHSGCWRRKYVRGEMR
ncbi:unnamed protein product [Pylaiella littoralis]